MTPDIIYWTLVENTPDLLKDAERFLSPAELEKLATFRFPKRRTDWLLGRWTAKSLLRGVADYARFAPADIELYSAPRGAPRVRLPDDLPFPGSLSISHRDERAFCALSLAPGLNLGADLEKVEPRAAAFTEDYFTTAEKTWVRDCGPEQTDLAATLVWSAKESMLKALEVGLGWDTRWVEVGPAELSDGAGWKPLRVSSAAKEEHPWQARGQRNGAYVLTVAGFGGAGELRLVQVDG